MAEVGVDVEPRGTALVDHVDFVKASAGGHSVVAASRLVNSSAILGNYPDEVTPQAPVACATSSTYSPFLHARRYPSLFHLRRRLCCSRASHRASPLTAPRCACTPPAPAFSHAMSRACCKILPLPGLPHDAVDALWQKSTYCCMQATAVLSGPDTAFSHALGKPVTEAPAVAHANAVLVAGVQVSSPCAHACLAPSQRLACACHSPSR